MNLHPITYKRPAKSAEMWDRPPCLSSYASWQARRPAPQKGAIKNGASTLWRRNFQSWGLVLFALLGAGAFPTSLLLAQSRPEINSRQVRNDIEIFEAIVNQALGQLFPNPFALVDRSKGVYLNDYGVVITFGVNIKAAAMETPFGTVTRPETADPKQREQKVADLRERLVEVVGDYGNAINQLRETDSVTVVAHIVDPNYAQASRNRTIVLRAFKRDIAAKASRQIDSVEFKKRIRTIEY